MTDRYHVQVRVREGGDTYAWRRVHPNGDDPYVFTRKEAEDYIHAARHVFHGVDGEWRLEELPDDGTTARERAPGEFIELMPPE